MFNVNEPDRVHRIELPRRLLRINKTYITSSYDLFVLTEGPEHYYVYRVNLDTFADKEKKEGRILTVQDVMYYEKTEVKDAPILDFHVRGGSSDKGKVEV